VTNNVVLICFCFVHFFSSVRTVGVSSSASHAVLWFPPVYIMLGGGGSTRPSSTLCPFGQVVPIMLSGSLTVAWHAEQILSPSPADCTPQTGDFSPPSSPLFALMPACVTGRIGLADVAPFTPNSHSTMLIALGDRVNRPSFIGYLLTWTFPASRGPRMIFRPTDHPGPTPILPAGVTACGCFLRLWASIRTRHAGLSHFALRDSFGHPWG
jgi:hypothetical protein